MDLWTIIKVMVRRWHVSVPVLLLTGAACLLAAARVDPTYQSVGSVLFVQPNEPAPGDAAVRKGNPYLVFSGSLGVAANAVARVITNGDQRQALVQMGLRGDYDVRAEESFPGLTFIVEGFDQDVVVKTSLTLLESVKTRLAELEEKSGAPADQGINLEVLSAPATVVELPPKTGRLLVTIFALGIAASVGLTLLVDAFFVNRRADLGRLRGSRSSPGHDDMLKRPQVVTRAPRVDSPRRHDGEPAIPEPALPVAAAEAVRDRPDHEPTVAPRQEVLRRAPAPHPSIFTERPADA